MNDSLSYPPGRDAHPGDFSGARVEEEAQRARGELEAR